MSGRPEQPEFEEIALLTGIEPSYIEKDWFVTQVVAALAAFRYEGFEFIFAGGTALSKADKERFAPDGFDAVSGLTCQDENRTA
jgi:predicted nucleotidyltransferase component of viral defense system